jgi:hypothetical protein
MTTWAATEDPGLVRHRVMAVGRPAVGSTPDAI